LDGIDIDANEALNIIISVVAISFGFALVFAGTDGIVRYPREFVFFMAAVFVTLGSGFVLHEMAHKLSSLYYGLPARFMMSVQGLALTIISGLMGFMIGLPGATVINPEMLPLTITLEEYAIVSLMGPLMNIALVALFLLLNAAAPISQYYSFLYTQAPGFEGFGIIGGQLMVWKFGAALNLWLALFNIIPAFPLDGSKVWRWNPLLWIIVTVLMLGLGSLIIGPAIITSWLIIAPIMILISKLIFGWSNEGR
jgi:Zn-dependent protease